MYQVDSVSPHPEKNPLFQGVNLTLWKISFIIPESSIGFILQCPDYLHPFGLYHATISLYLLSSK
jgi:hypothetical protein